MRHPSRSAFALLLALAPGAAGERLAIPPVDESIDVRVVNVEAEVTDRTGRAVHGLTAADFRLLIDKQEVPISYFSEVADGAVAAAEPGPGAPAPAVPASRSFLVFIDESTSIGVMRDFTLDRLGRDLPSLGPADRVALVAFDGARLTVLSGWSGDREEIAATLAQALRRPAHGIGLLATRREALEDQGLARSAMGDDFRWAWTNLPMPPPGGPDPFLAHGELLEVVNQVAQAAGAALRALPLPAGRKSMLLLSGGMPLGIPGPLLRDAGQLGYTVYPVEVQGIDPLGSPNDVTRERPSNSSRPLSTEWQRISDWTFAALARETGGQVLSGRDHALAQAAADTSSYYSLGFAPQSGDGAHTVRVELRRRGLTVRARRSYFTATRGTLARIAAQSVLLYGGDPAAKRIDVALGTPRRGEKGQMELPVTLQLPVEALPLTAADAGYQTEISFGATALDADGRIWDVAGQRLEASFPDLPKSGTLARFQTVVQVHRGGQRLVFAVPDMLGGTSLWGEVNVAR